MMFQASKTVFRLMPRAQFAQPSSQVIPRAPRSNFFPLTFQTVRSVSRYNRDDPPPPKQPIDLKAEKEIAQRKLEPRPSEVSTKSSVRHVIEPSGPAKPPSDDEDLNKGLKHDVEVIKDTFRLSEVPRESHILGLAGTLPYLGTSLSTIFLSWDLNREWPTGNAFFDSIFIEHDTARHLLSVIEPLQLGYGAVIISFLGAIHWGLEYAEKQPSRERTRFRYGMGLASSIVAWPTLYMPVPYALTTQFGAFVALYFADSNAARRGWAPHWYGTYRFLLTAMVGLAIFVSLVGRAKIQQAHTLNSDALRESMSKPGIVDHQTNWAKLEQEEKQRIKKEKEEAEKKANKEEKEKKKAKKQSEKKNGDKDDGEEEAEAASDKQNDGQEDDSGKKENGNEGDKKNGEEVESEGEKNGKEYKGDDGSAKDKKKDEEKDGKDDQDEKNDEKGGEGEKGGEKKKKKKKGN